MDNTITVSGNVTREPELKYIASGQGLVKLGIAVNRRWQKDGEWQEEVSFFDVTAWGQLAENCAATLQKGSRVVVTGRLQQRSWENDEGEKRYAIDIVADDIGASLKWATAHIERTERTQVDKDTRREAKQTAKRQEPLADEEPF